MTPSPAPSLTNTLRAAVQHHQAGRLAEAEGLYRQILEVEPQNSDALHLLGVIAHQRGQYEAAIGMIQRAIALKPAAESYNNCGEACRALGRQEEAIAYYRKAVSLNPGFALAHNNLGIVHQARGELDLARGCYERAIVLAPTLADTHYRLGQIHAAQGDMEKAASCFEKSIQHDPASAPAYFELGNALQQRGRFDQAIAHYQKALELAPNFPEALNNLGNAFQSQEKFDAAIACYAKALKLRPDYAMAHNNLGNIWLRQGRPEAAIACYKKVIALKPDFAETYYNLGNVLYELGRLDEAEKSYEKTIALKPDHAEAHYNLGMALRMQGLLDKALACFRKALSCKPDYLQAHAILAIALQEAGKLDESIATFHTILGIPPDYTLPAPANRVPHSHSIVATSGAKGAQDSSLTIVTSIAPKNTENQRQAVESWQRLGFKVASVNSADEIGLIEQDFSGVEFIPAARDARREFMKPYVYFDDVLDSLRDRNGLICGIVNSDIHLLHPDFREFILKEARDSFVFGSRVEIPSLDKKEGEFYDKGYDFFFFDRKYLDIFPRERFCLGLPWWDYWAVLVPILRKIPVKKVITPAGYHVTHPINWDDNNWAIFGLVIAKYIGASKPPSREYLNIYDKYIWTYIENRTQKILIPDKLT